MRNVGYALNATYDDKGEEYGHAYSDNPWRDVESARHRQRYAVALHGWHEKTAGEGCNNGKDAAEQRAMQPFFNIIRRTAAKLSVVVFLVDLRQRGLDKSTARPEKGNNPHPHYCAGATEADGGGHTDNVARSHTSRQSHCESLER